MGLMPAERRGTVTDDIEGYIKRVKNSSEWKADRVGNIRMPIARVRRPTFSSVGIYSPFCVDGFPYRGCR